MISLRHQLRSLSRTPGFTFLAICILALGIGANTAVFSMVHAVLLRPLPYQSPDRLVHVWGGLRTMPGNRHDILTGEDITEIASGNSTLQSFAAFKFWGNELAARMDLVSGDSVERLRGVWTTSGLFDLLGVKAALGRTFAPSDAEGDTVLVISDGLWRRRFAADPAVIGRRVLLMAGSPRIAASYTIIGVLPADVRFSYPQETEAYAVLPWSTIRPDSALQYQMIARLKDGVSPGTAQAELTAIAQQAAIRGVAARDRNRVLARTAIMAEPVSAHLESDTRPGMLLLTGVAALVLLIACVNLGLLVLARTVDRRREIAIRTALGAAPARILRQVLAEGATLASAGGLAAIAAVAVTLPLLRSLVPPLLPRGDEIGVDGHVLAFALAATAVTAIVCGLAPAWIVLRQDCRGTMHSNAATTADPGLAFSRRLVVGLQVAVVLVLLVCAGLLLRSLWRLHDVDLGFDARGVVTMEMRLLNGKYRQEGREERFQEEVLSRVRALPGVAEASITTAVPMRGTDFLLRLAGGTRIRSVDPEYFALMRIPLKTGRLFRDTDTVAAPPVTVISESLANKLFGSESPLGKRLEEDNQPEIIGVVGDVRYADVTKPPQQAIYVPRSQSAMGLVCLIVRPRTPGLSIAPDVLSVIHRIDPEQPVEATATIDGIVAASTSERRFYAVTTGGFAVTALLLAVVGLFGVVARSVTERRREIAIRIALGADVRRLLMLVLRHGLVPVAVGTLAGLATALAASRMLEPFLFEVAPSDPVTYGGVALLVAVVAVIACYAPGRRATRLDPMSVLKSE